MGIRSVTVYVLGDGTGLTRVLNQSTIQIDRWAADVEKKSGRVGDILSSNLTKGIAVGGVAVAAALGVAAAAAVPFEASMRNVSTISDEVRNNFAGASQEVLNLASTVPQSATTLANALYEITSSNFAGADAFHVLDVSAKAASAGLTDADTAARAITGALNAYGLSAASAGDVSDILFQVVNKGVVTFHDLAQNLGDFVGVAAAAKVPLQDVGSAYAAITLAGVPASEAATSVNQLLTKLIKPTDQLADAYKTLGYESGASALQQKGLQAVIKDIGRVTGGSADQLVRMFNDVRAGRGVLALLSADGKNYQAAVDGIADASVRTGSTQRAFAEQMKSTQAQLTLFKNGAEAAAISVGLKVLPALNEFLTVARQTGGDALPYLEAAMNRVAPVFEQLWAVIGNLAHLLVEIGKDVGPFVEGLLKIGGAVVVGPLLLFLNVLKAITGFLAEHRGVVEAVAAIYLAKLIPGLVAAGVQMTVAAARTVYLTVTTAAYVVATDGAAAAATRLGSASALAGAAMTAGLGVAIFAVVRGYSQWNDAQEQAKRNTDDVRKSFDALDSKQAQATLDGLRARMEHAAAVGQQYTGVLGELKAGLSEVVGDGSVGKLAADGAAASDAYAELSVKLENTKKNLGDVSATTGLTSDALAILAKRANIDLSSPFESSADARRRLIGYVKDLDNQSAVTSASMAKGAEIDVQAMEELEKAVQKVVDAATAAFDRDTDVLGKYDPKADAKKVADAQEALAKARKEAVSGGGGSAVSSLRDEQRIARDRQAIRDAEAKALTNHSRSERSHLTDQQAINRQKQRLADDEALIGAKGKGGSSKGDSKSIVAAEQRLADAQAEAAQNSLKNRYKASIKLAEDFTRDINAATQRGLDPNIIGRLLAEGPAKAEPILQELLADHSGRMIALVNDSEQKLSELSGFVAEQARLTAKATQAGTDQYTHDLKTAQALAAAIWASGGRASMAALVKNLKVPEEDIRRIAAEFGINISEAIQSTLDKRPVYVNAKGRTVRVEEASSSGRGGQKPRAEGGPIDWGPPGRDMAEARVTRGEWVHPVAAVQHYGTGFMEAVRTRTLPKFWDGGLVGAGGMRVSNVMNMAGPRLVPVLVPVANRQTTDNSATYNIDRVVVGSFDQVPAAAGGRTYSAMKGVS